jgi:tripartite-type tricarboxylate transporter receptor subunit TctC
MPQFRSFSVAYATLAAALIAIAGNAFAQSYPAHPIRIVVPFTPAGATDLAARVLADRMAPLLGQPVVIDNKPGAASAIGMALVANSQPDGYTLGFAGAGTYSVLPAVRTLSFDMQKDLAPLALVARIPLVIVVPASSPYRNLADLAAAARKRSDGMPYYTYGPGSSPQLVGAMLAREGKFKVMAVPYKGSSEATLALMRGDVEMGVDTVAALAAYIRAGKMRPLAITGSRRTPFLADVPTVAEAGFPGTTWDGYLAASAPAGTSPAIRARLTEAMLEIMKRPDVRAAYENQSLEPVAVGPDEFGRQMAQEIKQFRQLSLELGLRLD